MLVPHGKTEKMTWANYVKRATQVITSTLVRVGMGTMLYMAALASGSTVFGLLLKTDPLIMHV